MDSESAYEVLNDIKAEEQEKTEFEEGQKRYKEERCYEDDYRSKKQYSDRRKTSTLEKITNSAMTSIGKEIGRSLIRGILGSLKK